MIILETDNIIVSVLEDRIFSLKLKNFRRVTLKDARQTSKSIVAYFNENNLTESGMLLLEYGYGATIDKAAREYASSEEGNIRTHGAAILVKSSAQQMVGEYYLRFNHPRYPTKVFYKKEKALDWIRTKLES